MWNQDTFIKLKEGLELSPKSKDGPKFIPMKVVKGDKIDELFAFHLNKHQLSLKVTRIQAGKYMFGTR